MIAGMSAAPGLRERKKLRTHQQIVDAAFRLFAARGFDGVTVVEVAREADVSEATVFNYFPNKEDLVYHRMQAFEEDMLSAIRERPEDQSLLEAFGAFVLVPRGSLAATDDKAAEGLRAITRIITGSPALLAHERGIYERYTVALAAQIAEENNLSRDDVEPWVVANALIGLHRALIDYVRRRILAGAENKRIAREVRTHGMRALALLAGGIAADPLVTSRRRAND
jgi:AcrR family transcriptional regulator